jgi:hypothetical protein
LAHKFQFYFSPSNSTDASFGNSPLFDLDLGAFELVDSGGMSAEALLSHEDPVIFHRDMPVYSVHHDTVQTEAVSQQLKINLLPFQALESLMNAPESMLTTSVPPALGIVHSHSGVEICVETI